MFNRLFLFLLIRSQTLISDDLIQGHIYESLTENSKWCSNSLHLPLRLKDRKQDEINTEVHLQEASLTGEQAMLLASWILTKHCMCRRNTSQILNYNLFGARELWQETMAVLSIKYLNIFSYDYDLDRCILCICCWNTFRDWWIYICNPDLILC